MANPNPQIYRTPEHWLQCKILSGASEGVNRPKIIDWDNDDTNYRTGVLSHGADNNYFAMSQPLDVTLCPTGQHPSVSCFSEIQRFSNPQNDADAATPTEIIERKNAPCNWTFGEVLALGGSLFGAIRDKSSALQRWSPNSANDQGKNTNWNFSPYVTWGVRGALLQIRVMTITSYDNYNGVLIPHYNDNNIMSLDEWKNNHSTEPLQGIDFVFYGNSGESENTIRYATSWIYNDGTCVGVCSIDRCGEYANEPFYDYTRGFFNRTNFFGLLPAGLNENYNDTADSLYFYGLDKLQGAEIRGVANPDNGWRLGAVVPYSQANYDAIMKMAACFAMAFTPTTKNTFTLTDNDYYLPIIRADGVSYGEYTHGTDNATNTTAQISDIRAINYDPTANIDPNTYSTTTHFNTVGNVASTTKAYVVNANAIQGLSNELWTVIDNLLVNPSDIENLYNLSIDSFLTNNPIDAIVSIKKFPLDHVPHGENLENIALGKYSASAAGYPLAMQQARYNFKAIPIYPKFGNCFLDYSPYTKMQLYVPFCGTIDIDAADFMGRRLSVEMAMDFITGTVTAYILSNELVVTSVTGTCAIDIPITGTEQATVNSAYESAAINERMSRATGIVNEFAGRFAHPLKSVLHPISSTGAHVNEKLQHASSVYELTHINTPLRQIGNASPLNSWELEFVCRLIIYYPDGECITFNATNEPTLITEKVEAFGAVNGFATVETNTLSHFSGFTQVSDVDLSGILATDTEKEMIANLLQSGVYL